MRGQSHTNEMNIRPVLPRQALVLSQEFLKKEGLFAERRLEDDKAS